MLVQKLRFFFGLVLLIPFVYAQDSSKPRIFITDSKSWEMVGGFGASNGNAAGATRGGARPQTAEIIKTFNERCPDTLVTMKESIADYIVMLDHEGGKGLVLKDNKFAVFDRNGDAIKSGSTRSLGNSVKEGCSAIMVNWNGRKVGNNPIAPEKSNAKNATSSVVPPPVLIPTTPPVPTVSTASTELSTIDLKSTPDGAEITIDGKFVGNTPSVLKLAPGDHSISIVKAGFIDWKRTMSVSSNSNLTLSPTLEPAMIVLTSQPVKEAPVSIQATEPGSKAYADCGQYLKAVPVTSSLNGLKTLACGEDVTVVSHDRNWTRVRSSDGKEGAVQSVYISEKKAR